MTQEQGETQSDDPLIFSEWNKVILGNIPRNRRDHAASFLDGIVTAYSEPKRYYHNLNYVESGLALLADYRKRPTYPQLFMATVMRKAVYNPLAPPGVNARQSASLAAQMMEELGLFRHADNTRQLVMATATHTSSHEDGQLISAIDLSVLAQPWEVYQHYADAIRKEYIEAKMPEAVYAEERYKELDVLTKRSRWYDLFQHQDFFELNRPAYENLSREMRILSKLE